MPTGRILPPRRSGPRASNFRDPVALLVALGLFLSGRAWKLRVRDLAAIHVGTLNSWEIDFRAP
jgi:subtilisin-like proprotein convertase family protein